MKVDLEKITLGYSPQSGNIFAGTILKEGVWRNKIDVTNAFIDCVVAKWKNKKETFTCSDGSTIEISVKKTKPTNTKD
jgi:hypothetical protein